MMKFIFLKDPDKKFHIMSNRIPKNEDGTTTALRLQFAMRKFLEKETTILGFLPEDPAVHKAVVAQKPYLLLYPSAPISKRMSALAGLFVQVEQDNNRKKGIGFLGKLRNVFTKGRG